MESSLLGILGSGGVTASICALFYFFMHNNFKQNAAMQEAKARQDVIMHENINKLCEKIDLLVESIYKLQTDNALSAKESSIAYLESKEHYAKISYKIDDIEKRTEDIVMICNRTFDKLSTSANIGAMLVKRGIITQEQLDDALEEQRKYA